VVSTRSRFGSSSSANREVDGQDLGEPGLTGYAEIKKATASAAKAGAEYEKRTSRTDGAQPKVIRRRRNPLSIRLTALITVHSDLAIERVGDLSRMA
jgi:hypothetical protein